MRRTALLLIVLCISSAATAARAEKWWESYEKGVQAARAGKYAAAVQALQAAVAEMPNENADARVRNNSFVYVPHFWLGISKFNLGDVDGGMRELRISEEQGVVQKTRYYADLREWISRGQAQKQKQSADVAAEGKRTASAAVKAAVAAQGTALAAGADRSDPYRAGLRKLKEAQSVSANAGIDLNAYRRATDLAEQARSLFTTAAQEKRKQKAAPPVVIAQAPAKPATPPPSVVEATPPARSDPPPAAAPAARSPAAAETRPEAQPVVSAAVAEARVAVQKYRRKLTEAASDHRGNARFRAWSGQATREANRWQQTLSGETSDATAREIASHVEARQRELGLRVTDLKVAARAATPPPSVPSTRSELERAWRAYVMGDLARADQLLTRIIATAGAPAEAYLLRACGRYTQAMLSRRPDTLLGTAEADFRSALKLNRNLRLDRQVFSPKLVAYFEAIRGK